MATGNFGNGLWIAFIGWFLETAAASQVKHQSMHDLLVGHKVSASMQKNFTIINRDTTIDHIVNEHILGTGRRSLVVEQNGQVFGLLTLHDIKKIQRTEWSTASAEQVMIPIEKVKRIQPEAELMTAIEEMDRDGVNQLPVMVDEKILGMLSRDDVIGLLRTLNEFKR